MLFFSRDRSNTISFHKQRTFYPLRSIPNVSTIRVARMKSAFPETASLRKTARILVLSLVSIPSRIDFDAALYSFTYIFVL